MPSDERVAPVMKALAGSRAGFHSAVVTAVGEVEAFLTSHRPAGSNGRGAAVSAELGPFGSGRIDPDRFAALLAEESPLDEATVLRLRKAQEVLREIAGAGDTPYRVDVVPGGDLASAVAGALAFVGRAFGAARVAESARSARPGSTDDAAQPYPFTRWNRAERMVAPPLVIEVDGGDLLVGGLATFLDGRQKMVLVVRGPAPDAALARLVTPGVFVMQTADVADLVRFAAFEGPGIAALVPETAALFTHDPAATPRLTAKHVPEEGGKRPVGRISAFQQAEALKQLALLRAAGAEAEAAAGTGAGAGTAGAGKAAPADLLAALLIKQANLTDAGA